MPIIASMGTAQIQMTRHLLQEMEAEGIVDLAQARERLQREEDGRRRELRMMSVGTPRRPRPPSIGHCPECGKPLTQAAVEQLLIRACRACRWSAIVEG